MNSPTEVVFVTGLSGSGKSTALDALEDIGYFCIDNLPIDLIKKLIELIEHADISKLAIACDIRDINIIKLKDIHEWLNESNIKATVIFLEAKKETIVKRYEQTRRNHPLSLTKKIGLSEAIEQEISVMSQLKLISDITIDTSSLSPTSLRRFIFKQFSKKIHMSINLISFGFKYGIPIESDTVLDVRFITNPYFIDKFRNTTGLDKETYEFVMSQQETKTFLNYIEPSIKNLIPLYEKEGKSYLTISVGCTGGKHRSVAVVEYLKNFIEALGFEVKVFHRDVER
jgi:UPF0042 nucleotide-binding protein